jgi:hypothetical protein
VDAGKIEPARKGQSHRRPVDQHWIGSDGESKEESGQQGCWEHVWEPNFLEMQGFDGGPLHPFYTPLRSNEPYGSTSPEAPQMAKLPRNRRPHEWELF